MRTLAFDVNADNVPHFEHWLGVWFIESQFGERLISSVNDLDIVNHLREQSLSGGGSRRDIAYQVSDGVAIIPIHGAMQKHSASMMEGASTVEARRKIRMAVNDDKVGAIFLDIESPGGTSAGTAELAADIRAANNVKPVVTHFTDLGASAAYWAGSASGHVSANESALVGSIGTYLVAQDTSELASNMGVKVHVIKAGDMKGTGVPGTEITEDQLASLQERVDSRNEFFLNGVATNRSMDRKKLESLATGELFTAKQALSNGLIDSIETDDSAFENAREMAESYLSSKKKPRKRTMSEASIADFKAACPGANSDFLLSCVEKSLGVDEASRLWAQDLATELAAAQEQITNLEQSVAEKSQELAAAQEEVQKLTTKLEEAPALPGKTGAKALPVSEEEGDDTGTSATDSYWGKVKEMQVSGKTRSDAMREVNKLFPDLRKAMSAEFNSAR